MFRWLRLRSPIRSSTCDKRFHRKQRLPRRASGKGKRKPQYQCARHPARDERPPQSQLVSTSIGSRLQKAQAIAPSAPPIGVRGGAKAFQAHHGGISSPEKHTIRQLTRGSVARPRTAATRGCPILPQFGGPAKSGEAEGWETTIPTSLPEETLKSFSCKNRHDRKL
jgi:hypothetical protein